MRCFALILFLICSVALGEFVYMPEPTDVTPDCSGGFCYYPTDALPTLATNYYMDFGGTDEYLQSTHIAKLKGSAQMTLAFWARRDGSATHLIAGQWDTGQAMFDVGYRSSESMLVRVADGITGGFSDSIGTSQPVADPGGTNHFVIVYDGTQGSSADRIDIYTNGVLAAKSTSGTIATNLSQSTSGFQIGGGGPIQSSARLNGMVDEFGIWTQAISAVDITNVFNAGMTPKARAAAGKTPVAWYSMGKTGTNIYPTVTNEANAAAYPATMNNMEPTDIKEGDAYTP